MKCESRGFTQGQDNLLTCRNSGADCDYFPFPSPLPGNVVVHFMLPETREIYGLERLWTLRSYDDQLAEIVVESLPDDFIFGLTSEQ